MRDSSAEPLWWDDVQVALRKGGEVVGISRQKTLRWAVAAKTAMTARRSTVPIDYILIARLAVDVYKTERLKRELAALNDKVSDLIQHADQLLMREVAAGFQALQDACQAKDPRTREARLQVAEHLFLLDANLQPHLTTAGRPNYLIIGTANQGLALASFLRGENHLAASYILRCFIASPRQAREHLFSDFYQTVIAPQCLDLVQQHERDIEDLVSSLPTIRANLKHHVNNLFLGAGALAGIGMIVSAPLFLPFAATWAASRLAHAPESKQGKPAFSGVKFVSEKREKLVDHFLKEREASSRKSILAGFENGLDQRSKDLCEALLSFSRKVPPWNQRNEGGHSDHVTAA